MGERLYGREEHRWCAPFAEALVGDAGFRRWVLERAGVGDAAASAQPLRDEQRASRPRAAFWWKNYFCHEKRCRCAGLAGREIDVLAVFEVAEGRRIGLHVECKHPGDHFRAGQAEGYRRRASCWVRKDRTPPTVPPHDTAITVLLCHRDHRHSAADVDAFDVVLYFDEIADRIRPYPAPLGDGDPTPVQPVGG